MRCNCVPPSGLFVPRSVTLGPPAKPALACVFVSRSCSWVVGAAGDRQITNLVRSRTPGRGSCTFFFLYFFLKWGYFFFWVGYFFLTFFLLSLTFERQEKAGKDRKRSKKERAREKAGIAPPARPRRACEGACPPYTCVALPHPPLSPAVCLHARCPTRDCA